MKISRRQRYAIVGILGGPERWYTSHVSTMYEISTHGNVRSLHSGAYTSMRQQLSPSGYYKIWLSTDGRQTAWLVSRLVLWTFIGPPPSKLHHAAHNDGAPTNNKLANLRWATPTENNRDKIKHGTRNTKVNEDQVVEIRERYADGEYASSICSDYDLTAGAILHIVAGKTHKHVSGTISLDNRHRCSQNKPQGSRHPGSKLTENDVLEIRRRYAAKELTQTGLADEYMVGQTTIWNIVTRRKWTHL